MRTIYFSILLRLVILIALVIPFVGQDNTLSVIWDEERISISLAVAVFVIVIVYLVIHTLFMQVNDLSSGWKRHKYKKLSNILSATKQDLKLLLSNSATEKNIDSQTKQLSKTLNIKQLKQWGGFLTTLNEIENYSIVEPNKALLSKLHKNFNSLDIKNCFADKAVRANVLWRVALLKKETALIKVAKQEMQEYDPDNPIYCNYIALEEVKNNNWQKAISILEQHKNINNQLIGTTWLYIAELIHKNISSYCENSIIEHEEEHNAHAQKDAHGYKNTQTKTDNRFDSQQEKKVAIFRCLKYSGNCYEEIKSSEQYLILQISLLCMDEEFIQAKRLISINAPMLIKNKDIGLLWLQSNKININQLSSNDSQKVLDIAKKWLEINKSNALAKLTYIELCFLLGYPQIGEPAIEELLRNDDGITADIRNKLVSILVTSGHGYTDRYLHRLGFQSAFSF